MQRHGHEHDMEDEHNEYAWLMSRCLSMPGLDQNEAEKPSSSLWALIRPPAMATAPTHVGPH